MMCKELQGAHNQSAQPPSKRTVLGHFFSGLVDKPEKHAGGVGQTGESQEQTDLMERAQELLKLETVPRELVVGLTDKIEIGEKQPDTGRQNASITWKFW